MNAPDLSGRFRLDGKVAIVTGSSSGLGVAFALALAGCGADVVLAARRFDRLVEVASAVEQFGRRAVAVETDVADPGQCERLVARTMGEFGRVDILVNNAGVSQAAPATRESPDDFRRVVDVNLNGVFWMAQACARVMLPGSSIVNIGSVLGSTTDFGLPQASYCATKSAVIGLTRDLAQQWSGRKGILVNVLAPGYFPSEMTDPMPEGHLDRLVARRVPMQRIGVPEEVAAALVFLASDAASYITGATLPVDGGLLVT
ncbi:MAG: 3-oxoacyl-ACP reductase FabG [Burkholderiaceae bacterium]|nr:MAG: 3-oxoacyl-ACP reductase FabG [Burkholderiaceae bacterium]